MILQSKTIISTDKYQNYGLGFAAPDGNGGSLVIWVEWNQWHETYKRTNFSEENNNNNNDKKLIIKKGFWRWGSSG